MDLLVGHFIVIVFVLAYSCVNNLTYCDIIIFLEVYYFYYSHIFPGFRAQHCNYATLLAGGSSNNLWYSVIYDTSWVTPTGTRLIHS